LARYDDERLETFFAHYGEALITGDLPAIAGCYAVPALVLSHTGSVPIATREQIEAAFRGAAEGYEAQGLVATRPTLLGSEYITEWLVSADVHWDTVPVCWWHNESMPKILYQQVITEDPQELKELEKRHRYTHLFQRVRMLRLLKSGRCSNLGEAAKALGYSWRQC
jgi:hypothetical protein